MTSASEPVVHGTDEPAPTYERPLASGALGWALFAACVAYAAWHLYVLNIAPMETLRFRISHVAGALAIGFVIAMPAVAVAARSSTVMPPALASRLGLAALAALAWPAFNVLYATAGYLTAGIQQPAAWVFATYGPFLGAGTTLALVASWLGPSSSERPSLADWALALSALVVAGFLLFSLDNLSMRLRAGTGFADPVNAWAAAVGVMLILELTRRVAGLALVVISAIFVVYAFAGPFLPGILEHRGYDAVRFFTYVYTDNGILGPTTAVSSTYIILFITFAAFLQASKVGDYFVNLAFAVAGRARGGPAKVSIFASGLMGMINGTSAGNVVATGSLTIPMMKRVGYRRDTAGAIEAAASTGGQIMPPIMGAGAFIMAEITGIPYTEIAAAALIPALLYFVSVYFMVDFEAAKLGMRGMRGEEVPRLGPLARQAFLFIPIVILITALFTGYSVIRAGTYAIAASAAVSWLTPFRMGPVSILRALNLATRMSIQIIAVCACAGIIVGVISLTGIGARFSSLLLGLAGVSQLAALLFAMLISILLGMGMPTTAAYAVAASVVAPGLIQLGIAPLVAHFFVFYFAVVSAITPPVALASYAAAGISGANAMRTSVASFKVGITAFIVPFMFFYNSALLMDGAWPELLRAGTTATIGVFLLSAGAQGWFMGARAGLASSLLLVMAALLMIEGAWLTDIAGLVLAAIAYGLRPVLRRQTGQLQSGAEP
ncbi:MAG: TRAP transporter fused permease subunit [Pseudomonadota bacterium]